MDTRRFDSLARALATTGTRRGLLTLLAALPLWPELSQPSVAFAKNKKKGKKKKATLCLDGQTLTVGKSKKKLRKLRKRGATPGACQGSPPPPPSPPVCTPSCPGTTCGGDDGCGGACGCAAGSLCHLGLCKPCDIACPPGRGGCGDDLQALLTRGGTVIACPGRYIGNFEPGNGTLLIGAGDGDDPATSTILDANGNGRVVNIAFGTTVTLKGIRIRGGAATSGGGVQNEGTLALTECTVTGNEATSGTGGIMSIGSLTLTRCRVTSNKSTNYAGGIGVYGGTTTLVRSVVSQNEARFAGGGIRVSGSGTLRVSDSSQITRNNSSTAGGGISTLGTVVLDASSSVTDNTSTAAPSGIQRSSGTVALNGATVSGNTPTPQCTDGIGCPP